jgi:DNA-binding MarR family transcriptional regulator
VDGLVNIKMVDRIIPKENRRLALTKLTDSGKQVCSSINYTNESYVREVMHDFTAEEGAEFLSLFSRLTNNMIQFRNQRQEASSPETGS